MRTMLIRTTGDERQDNRDVSIGKLWIGLIQAGILT